MPCKFLKITATDGSYVLHTESHVCDIGISTSGKINYLAYETGQPGSHALTEVDPVPAYTGSNTKYELVDITDGPLYRTLLSN